jgi:hypothetical protein
MGRLRYSSAITHSCGAPSSGIAEKQPFFAEKMRLHAAAGGKCNQNLKSFDAIGVSGRKHAPMELGLLMSKRVLRKKRRWLKKMRIRGRDLSLSHGFRLNILLSEGMK